MQVICFLLQNLFVCIVFEQLLHVHTKKVLHDVLYKHCKILFPFQGTSINNQSISWFGKKPWIVHDTESDEDLRWHLSPSLTKEGVVLSDTHTLSISIHTPLQAYPIKLIFTRHYILYFTHSRWKLAELRLLRMRKEIMPVGDWADYCCFRRKPVYFRQAERLQKDYNIRFT